jgi:hypothetical protein
MPQMLICRGLRATHEGLGWAVAGKREARPRRSGRGCRGRGRAVGWSESP